MFANVVLLSWPAVVAILLSKKSIPVAVIGAIVAGYLLLPETIEFDIPLLPALQKHSIPALSLFLLILLGAGQYKARSLKGWLPRGVIPNALLFTLFASAFLTAMTNTDPIFHGPLFLPGLVPYDAFSIALGYLMAILPFFLARRFLAHPEHHRALLTILMFAGALYSFLALYEVRMSPQLSNMIYGYFPHSWLQHIRANGYRPIVFLQHGLWVSIFFTCTVLAAAGLTRIVPKEQKAKCYALCGWLLFTLVLTKSLGALAIALLFLPCVLFLKPWLQITLCAGLAIVVMTYPALRVGDYVPVDRMVEWAASVSEERAGSLQFRLDNEDLLLERARERPVFGWAAWGRSGVFNEYGQELTTPDGYWVIVIGVGGWIRYIAEFGLLCGPILVAALRVRKYRIGPETSFLVLILTANLLDLIPNATVTPLTWMLAGAIWGRLELGKVKTLDDGTDAADEPPAKQKVRYTRFASIASDMDRSENSHPKVSEEIGRKNQYHRKTEKHPVS